MGRLAAAAVVADDAERVEFETRALLQACGPGQASLPLQVGDLRIQMIPDQAMVSSARGT